MQYLPQMIKHHKSDDYSFSFLALTEPNPQVLPSEGHGLFVYQTGRLIDYYDLSKGEISDNDSLFRQLLKWLSNYLYDNEVFGNEYELAVGYYGNRIIFNPLLLTLDIKSIQHLKEICHKISMKTPITDMYDIGGVYEVIDVDLAPYFSQEQQANKTITTEICMAIPKINDRVYIVYCKKNEGVVDENNSERPAMFIPSAFVINNTEELAKKYLQWYYYNETIRLDKNDIGYYYLMQRLPNNEVLAYQINNVKAIIKFIIELKISLVSESQDKANVTNVIPKPVNIEKPQADVQTKDITEPDINKDLPEPDNKLDNPSPDVDNQDEVKPEPPLKTPANDGSIAERAQQVADSLFE